MGVEDITGQSTGSKKYYRPQRLKGFGYKSLFMYFLTLCTYNKSNYFTLRENVDFAETKLRETAEKDEFDIVCFCFMPDHLHLLVQGQNDDSDLIRFMKNYKQITGFYFKQLSGKQLWQHSYYDHIIRDDEDIHNVCRYIIDNPLRKGLVEDSYFYPYSWCKYYDVKTGETS